MTATSSEPPDLLAPDPAIITVGADLFADALRDQGVRHESVQWQPPADRLENDLAVLSADPRLPEANAFAAARLIGARPHLVAVRTAGEALGLDRGDLLHAGPPIEWSSASGPLRGALIGAMLLEGLADSVEDARRLAAQGGIQLSPCHHHRAVGPMAGVISASMPVFEIHDPVYGGSAWCTLNEGLGHVLRYGAYSNEVLERLRWMTSVLAPTLAAVVEATGPIDIRSMVAQALQMGDEAHNRNRAGTSLFLREIGESLLGLDAPSDQVASVWRFINGNDHFFLNLVMPAAKAAADSARDIPGSSVVVAMARNGTEFGVQVSGAGDLWFTAPATPPIGLLFPGYEPGDVNPDIGDSTITETWGVGGVAMACAPAIVQFVGGSTADAVAATRLAYEITVTENSNFQIPSLDFRGTPTGIDVVRVVRTGLLPPVNTGMAGAGEGTGQVGAGIATPPMACFTDAVRHLATVAAT